MKDAANEETQRVAFEIWSIAFMYSHLLQDHLVSKNLHGSGEGCDCESEKADQLCNHCELKLLVEIGHD